MIIYNIAKLKEKYPDGYKMPASERTLNGLAPWIRSTGIECGEFVRLITGHVGPNGIWKSLSPIANKKELVLQGRVPESGDIFVQEGGQWGHIGIVLRVLPNGDDYDLDIVDANVKLDGVIRYRKIKASSCYGFGDIGYRERWAKRIDDIEISKIDDRDYTADQVSLDEQAKEWEMVYRKQYLTGMCGAFAIASAVYALTGFKISPLALFVEAKDTYGNGDTSLGGISYRDILRFVRNYGVIAEKHVPFGDENESHEEKYLRARKAIKSLKNVKRRRFKYFRVSYWNTDEMRKVISLKTPVMISVNTFRNWHKGLVMPEDQPESGYHAVTLYDYENNDVFTAMDSLSYRGDDDGIRRVHKSGIVEAWGLVPVRERINERDRATRYGEVKDFRAEGIARAKIQEGISYLGQNRLTDAEQHAIWQDYAQNQDLYVNAVAYGGYNVLFIKWGFWQPGDLANYMYAKIKGRKLPFDLTKSRNNQ